MNRDSASFYLTLRDAAVHPLGKRSPLEPQAARTAGVTVKLALVPVWALTLMLFAACADNNSSSAPTSDTDEMPNSASEPDTSPMVGEDDERNEGPVEVEPQPRPDSVVNEDNPPVAADPCGDDLDADNGQISPDLGTLREATDWEGDLGAPGPYQVESSSHSLDNPDASLEALAVTIYSPSSDENDTPSATHPLVLILPGYGKAFGIGLNGLHPTYAFFSEHLASHGFMVVGMNFVAGGIGLGSLLPTSSLGAHFLTEQEKNVEEVRTVLDWALSESPASSAIDETKIAIAGHSQGGKLAFMAAAEDARIDMVIGWDPQNAGGGPPCGAGGPDDTCNRLPIAPNCQTEEAGRLHEMAAESLIFAARDGGSQPDAHQWAEMFYRGAPSPAHMLLFPDASHESWSDGDNTVSQLTMKTQLALLLTRFQNVQGLEDSLPGGASVSLADGTLEQFNK